MNDAFAAVPDTPIISMAIYEAKSLQPFTDYVRPIKNILRRTRELCDDVIFDGIENGSSPHVLEDREYMVHAVEVENADEDRSGEKVHVIIENRDELVSVDYRHLARVEQ